ncbi:hypothetical protein C1Y40_04457 [Mycobacterium talmoniae]|uniref:Transposase IS4-like domain-containing protein n=1 Tax=Mycobacterium talmoniae TaxID=1858794 RepID=A0A1S1NRD1_9MYCO|nr:hypothetical protein BKN37_05815 [Mycobacterium talmoniae]PQM45421.1 hypothetical protein C1Y40_04457 [Mycobacterium talmoniae]
MTSKPATFIIEAYHRLWRIEKAFRMSKHNLAARPIYHRTRESIDAHLTIVFAAMAISHYIETHTGWSIKKFMRTTRRYRTVTIAVGDPTLAAADHHPRRPRRKSAAGRGGRVSGLMNAAMRRWQGLVDRSCESTP